MQRYDRLVFFQHAQPFQLFHDFFVVLRRRRDVIDVVVAGGGNSVDVVVGSDHDRRQQCKPHPDGPRQAGGQQHQARHQQVGTQYYNKLHLIEHIAN